MSRFFRRGLSLVDFVPTVANKAAPTALEIAAGEALTPQIAEINGFEFSNSPITTPDLATTFTTQIPGEDTTSTSTLVFYDQDDDDTIRAALAKGTEGYIVFRPYGAGTGKRAEVWPVISTGVNDQWTTGNEAAKFAAAFAITAEPEQEGALP